MTCPCGNAVPDVVTFLGFCSRDCLDAEVFWLQIREPLAEMLASTCRRCAGDSLAPPECDACLGEVARNREDARREIREFIASDDGTDSGRRLA